MHRKLIPRDQVKDRLADLKKSVRKIVFTNGCFDLLHAGHVRYLAKARSLGDCLIVGLNSDRSMKAIKDPGRPLIPEDQRAEVLAALETVDWIILFDEPDPLALIEEIQPAVLGKGADWALQDIVGADRVTSYGGEVHRIELVPDISTTEIIRRVLDRYGKKNPEDPASDGQEGKKKTIS